MLATKISWAGLHITSSSIVIQINNNVNSEYDIEKCLTYKTNPSRTYTL